MTNQTGTERALPFLAAATLAVGLMALVVAPLGAQGGGFNSCTACINWVANSPNSPCAQYDKNDHSYNSPYNACKSQQTQAYCAASTSPFAVNGIAPCGSGGSQYADCGSDLCNQYPNTHESISICSNDCFGKACVDNSGPTCKNIQIVGCDGRNSLECTKCACTN